MAESYIPSYIDDAMVRNEFWALKDYLDRRLSGALIWEGTWSSQIYQENSVVRHSSKTWVSSVRTDGEPGIDADWVEV